MNQVSVLSNGMNILHVYANGLNFLVPFSLNQSPMLSQFEEAWLVFFFFSILCWITIIFLSSFIQNSFLQFFVVSAIFKYMCRLYHFFPSFDWHSFCSCLCKFGWMICLFWFFCLPKAKKLVSDWFIYLFLWENLQGSSINLIFTK